MKNNLSLQLLALYALVLLSAGCTETNAKKKGFTLTGTINALQSGTIKLIRNDLDNRTSTTFDSVVIKDGKFEFTGELSNPEMMTIIAEPGNWGFSVFMENADMTLKADTSHAEYYDWTAYGADKGATIKEYKLSGSLSQDQFDLYQNQPELKRLDPIFKELGKAYDTTTDKNENYAVKEKLDSLSEIYASIQKKWLDNFIGGNPSAAAGAYILNDYYTFHQDFPIADMERLIAKFSGEAKSTVYYKSLTNELGKRQSLQPGKPAPDFTLLKPDSSSFTLSSLRGKYVLLDFWASWCVPCRKSIPHWKELYNKYHHKDFEIVGITNDNQWNDWHKALKEENMPWLQVADEFPVKNMPARVGTLYMTPYLPTYILLDKEGKVVFHNASKEQIDNKLKEVL